MPSARPTASKSSPVPPVSELIPLRRVADQVGLTPDAVKKWTTRATGPLASWKLGGRVYTTQAALAAFIATNAPA